MLTTRKRILHRRLTLITALPLCLTVLTGSLYSLLQLIGFDLYWLMKLHTGNFFILNLQPFYSAILCLMTILTVLSGISLFKISKSI